jgi:streptogramin lyase
MMNTLHKSLTIALLAVSIFILELSVDLAGAQNRAAGTAASRSLSDPLMSRYLRFGRITTKDGLSSDQTRNVVQDKRGFMWFATLGGLSRYDGTSVKVYRHDPDDANSLSNNIARALIVDQRGVLWIGTWGGGLNRYDREKDAFIRYRHESDNPHSLSHDIVRAVYEDRSGTIWVGTMRGLNKLNRDSGQFTRYQHDPVDTNSLSNNIIWSISQDSRGALWVGTGNGLNRFDPDTERFVRYLVDPDDPVSISNNSVRSIHEDRSGNLWLGTAGGLDKLNPERARIRTYQHDANDPQSLSHNIIHAVHEDRSGRLWIGTYGGGINALDRETEQFTRYRHDPSDPHSLSANIVLSVLEDRAGVLWVGTTSSGLNKFNREAGEFSHFRHDASDPNSISGDGVTSIYEDRLGNLWIGTQGGLDKFDRRNNRVVRHYSTKNGLPNDTICGILEDEQGILWLSTQNGLSRFDPRSESFRNYNLSDGLQGNTFFLYSPPSKSRSGEMYFGGSNGFNAFYPDQIVDNLTPPPVLITNFQLTNRPVPIGAGSVLQKTILETDELVLSYQDNVFSFEFVALNFRAPEENRYKYKMAGFEDEWNAVDSTRRFATYTNLDPGDYVFRVIASNNDGVWNEDGASIRITVTPPWWETVWFRIVMGMVACCLWGDSAGGLAQSKPDGVSLRYRCRRELGNWRRPIKNWRLLTIRPWKHETLPKPPTRPSPSSWPT